MMEFIEYAEEEAKTAQQGVNEGKVDEWDSIQKYEWLTIPKITLCFVC